MHKILQGIVVIIRNFLIIVFLIFFNTLNVFAEGNSASVEMSFTVARYMQIDTVTSAVLTANITDNTGNLYAPLQSKFRVISNSAEEQTLYLKANTVTENGFESAIFEYGGQKYIAFAHVAKKPTGEALANCKLGLDSKRSPGIVAYPITSILGAKHKYQRGEGRYEVYVGNGTTNITVNVGSQVLRNSFDKNDPKGFYQATLSLTEADI